MECAEAEPLIGASLDGELDPQTALQVEEHVGGCRMCSALLNGLERLREEITTADLDWTATVDLRPLRAKIRRDCRSEWWRGPWIWRSAVGTIAAALLIMISLPARDGSSLEQQLVDNHVRSLLPNHLVDVPSSDRHTVKPWFQGKLSFAPSVPDLTADGFTLLGGRLDVIGGREAAALVYQRRQHVVNLWISPADGADFGVKATGLGGFHVLHWQQDRMMYWAVSDLNATELREFVDLFRAH